MFLTKVKIGTAVLMCAGLLTALLGGSVASTGTAQEADEFGGIGNKAARVAQTAESDEAFIRRISKDLRGREPSPAELHFFVTSKIANKRQKVIDLFIQERQKTERKHDDSMLPGSRGGSLFGGMPGAPGTSKPIPPRFGPAILPPAPGEQKKDKKGVAPPILQSDPAGLWQETYEPVQQESLNETLRKKTAGLWQETYEPVQPHRLSQKQMAALAHQYLDRLTEYVQKHPKNEDVPNAMLQIVLIYRSLGKDVEAGAWRSKLLKEHPDSPAARDVRQMQVPREEAGRVWYMHISPFGAPPGGITFDIPALKD